jgi:hypothetical protein
MYPHTITLFSYSGEVEGSAQYVAAPLDECRIEPVSGIVRALSGDALTGAVNIIVLHRSDLTIKPKDKLCEGSVEEIPIDAKVVISAEPLSVGSAAIHHWEVVAK